MASHQPPHSRTGLIMIVVAVALASVGTLTLLVRDRWHSPEVRPAELARHSPTGQAAAAAGAMVLPTDRKLAIEPVPAGPKQAQPPNPG